MYEVPYGGLVKKVIQCETHGLVISAKQKTKCFEPLFQPRRTERLVRKGCMLWGPQSARASHDQRDK